MSISKDLGASPDGDRAAGLTASAADASSQSSIPSARPRSSTPEVREAAIAELARGCAEWGNDSPEDWIGPLRQCGLHGDGYAMARDLERYSLIDPDTELVEILDGARHILWTAERAAVAEWVVKYDVRPPLKVGERVSLRRGNGQITSIREIEASYIVLPDEERDSPKYASGGGWVVAYEDASLIEAAAVQP